MSYGKVNYFRIMVIDDDEDTHDLMSVVLNKLNGWEIHIIKAYHGQEALELLEHREIDLIIADLYMPVMDGFELIREIRKIPKWKETPILFLSADNQPEKKIEAFQHGATDYIVKPFIPQELKARVSGYLERLLSYQLLLHQQHKLNDELQQAKETQKSLLPKELPDLPGLVLASKYVPRKELGGDLYDILELDDQHLGLMIADVTGHGISAALLAAMVSVVFKDSSSNLSTKLTIEETNERLLGKVPPGKFATIFYGIYHLQDHTFNFTNASHPDCLWLRTQKKEIVPLKTKGLIVGQFSNSVYGYEEKSILLEPGDKLLFYTDAVVEAMNDKEVMLGQNRLKRFLHTIITLPIAEILDELYTFGLEFCGKEHYEDDCTLLGLERSI